MDSPSGSKLRKPAWCWYWALYIIVLRNGSTVKKLSYFKERLCCITRGPTCDPQSQYGVHWDTLTHGQARWEPAILQPEVDHSPSETRKAAIGWWSWTQRQQDQWFSHGSLPPRPVTEQQKLNMYTCKSIYCYFYYFNMSNMSYGMSVFSMIKSFSHNIAWPWFDC